LAEIVNTILDLSLLSSNELPLSIQWTEIKPLVEQVIQTFSSLASTKNVRLRTSIQADLFVIKADSLRLKQILSNLIDNAIKFNTIGGQVMVSINKLDSEWVVFCVTDTGIGISKDQLSSIFQTFSHVDQGLSRRYSGLGIGLALTKYLVEIQKGEISAESEPGQGSSFTFKLPFEEMR